MWLTGRDDAICNRLACMSFTVVRRGTLTYSPAGGERETEGVGKGGGVRGAFRIGGLGRGEDGKWTRLRSTK